MLKKTFISVLVIVIGAFMLFKAYEFYKIEKEKEEREKERIAFCLANEAEYKKCGVDEKGKEITPYRVICRKQADEVTELNIKKLERKMGVLESQYNICQKETLRLAFARINDLIEKLNMVNSQETKCEEIAAEYNNLKDERKILIKERKVSQEYVKNHKNKCNFDLQRYREDCLRMGVYSLSKAGYGLGVEPCLGLYGNDEITYYEPE
ncbi:hypothetical protein [Campylobacter hyointestinalis]|uniref:hypothetical protein n=1 Tax=Campylobacter hyointestinalis TaxID=198 RepID=UPI000DCB4ED2|nr:hypothetical protein [Campylobacter hyointestinalis]RAZ57509.1 hypothetical protein CHL10074_00695 [Campylobacter hyointestinalis subsp. lawsonii]RAZ63707.1 hypothetical protein CHL9767_05865 [Campylobacter hyointestinalis subsp. lawsonii]